MTEEEVLNILMRSKCAVEELAQLEKQRTQPLIVNQRLTASYGTERTSGGKAYESPVLQAMIRQEARSEFVTHRAVKLRMDISRAKRLISIVRDNRIRIMFMMYYVENKSIDDVCRLFHWEEITYKRKHRRGLDILIKHGI